MKGSPFPAFLLLLLITEGGGIIVPFRCLINYMLLVCVVSVHSGFTAVSIFVHAAKHSCHAHPLRALHSTLLLFRVIFIEHLTIV